MSRLLSTGQKNKGLSADFKALCESKELKDTLFKDLTAMGKKEGLKGFEQIQDIYLSAEPFTFENGLTTPTFKSKRNALRAHFLPIINEMYTKAKQS